MWGFSYHQIQIFFIWSFPACSHTSLQRRREKPQLCQRSKTPTQTKADTFSYFVDINAWMCGEITQKSQQIMMDVCAHMHGHTHCIGRCPTAGDQHHKYSYIMMIAEMEIRQQLLNCSIWSLWGSEGAGRRTEEDKWNGGGRREKVGADDRIRSKTEDEGVRIAKIVFYF